MQPVAIIGAPIDLGAGRRGVDMGPSAIRYAGLTDRLAILGYEVRDLGNIPVSLAETIPAPQLDDRLRYLAPLIDANRTLAERVAAIVDEGAFPLVLGGDHSLSIGSVAGVARGRNIGLLWIDAHADFNTAETTPSGNIHGMSLAVLSGRGHPSLTSLFSAAPVVQEHNIALVAVRDIDTQERLAVQASGIHVFTMHDIDRRGMAAVMDEAMAAVSAGTDGFHLSLDLDSLDPREAPGVGTPVFGGLSYREGQLAMEMIASTQRLIGMDLVEVNPILDHLNKTAELAVECALSALGKRIL